jgi:hypothetical protein
VAPSVTKRNKRLGTYEHALDAESIAEVRPPELPALFDDTLRYKTEARLSIDCRQLFFPTT